MECRLACIEPVAAENPESSAEDMEEEVVRWPEEAALVSAMILRRTHTGLHITLVQTS